MAGRLPVLAGIGAPNTAIAIELAEDARQAGADGIVVFPHPIFVGEPLPWQVPYDYHKAIAEAVPLPMVLFQLQPGLGGVLYSREALVKLASIPTVVAVKEASFDAVRFVETVRALAEAPRRIQVLTGNDNFILESFVLGADGALIGFGTVAIAEQLEMLRLLRAGDLAGAQEVYDRVVQPLVDVIFAAAGAELSTPPEGGAGRSWACSRPRTRGRPFRPSTMRRDDASERPYGGPDWPCARRREQ